MKPTAVIKSGYGRPEVLQLDVDHPEIVGPHATYGTVLSVPMSPWPTPPEWTRIPSS